MRSVSEWSIQKGVERTPERSSRPNPGNGSSFSKQRCGNATVHQQMSRAGKELAFICMRNWILLLRLLLIVTYSDLRVIRVIIDIDSIVGNESTIFQEEIQLRFNPRGDFHVRNNYEPGFIANVFATHIYI